jgi:hypothetical protein
MAQRHVREGEKRVVRMVELIDEMDRHNRAAAAATGRMILETMRVSLDLWRLHLVRIE